MSKGMISIARLIKEMPNGYEDSCFSEKAIQRKRGISNPGDLMMLSLFHLLNGCSLLETSEIAKLTGLGNISGVAFMKRFEGCNNWFRRIISDLVTGGPVSYRKPDWLGDYRVVAVDASNVSEKGRSGRLYRLHFALDIFNMESLQYNITTQKTGESLKNFNIEQKDLLIADRAYSNLGGMEHCLDSGGDFILRLRKNSFKLYDGAGETVDIAERLRSLGCGDSLDLKVIAVGSKNQRVRLRVCARRKTSDGIAAAQKKMRREESKKQIRITSETKEFNEYIVLVTHLPDSITASQVLGLYRLRWQVEIYFKRLKSILDFGELPKRRPASVMAWLNGKLMIALLMEKIIGQANFPPTGECREKYVARDEAAVSVVSGGICGH